MSDPTPYRTTDNPEVLRALQIVNAVAWGEPYRPDRGPFHFATGPYWPAKLRSLASQWEKWAAAARIVADAMEETR